MATISITLPDELYQRLLSLQVDTHRVCLTALEAAVQGRTMKLKDEPKRAVGRPLKGEGRKAGTWQMEYPYQARIEAEATRLGVSRSDVLNQVLEKADEHGIMPGAGDETL